MADILKKTPKDISPARTGALALLHVLFQRKEQIPLPVMLARYGQEESLGRQDAALLAELVYGVLRRALLLDAALERFLKKPDALSAQVRMILRLGTYEILFMGGIPPRATVSEMVTLARRRFGQGMGALVNAVLRSAAREAEILRLDLGETLYSLECGKLGAEGMAYAASLPMWLTTMWGEQYGTAKACRMAFNTLAHPAPCWRVNMARGGWEMLTQQWLSKGYAPVGQGGFSAHGLEKVRHGAAREQQLLESLEKAGDISRQGAASQLVTQYIAAWIERHNLIHAPLWDACCGRGGKTAALLERGVHVALDSDPSAFRLEELKTSLLRLNVPMPRVICAPAESVKECFPLILLDVPCSGTGTLARNAELRLRLSPERIKEVLRMQASILEHAWTRLLPGGALFYVTCALNKEENENRAETFAKERGGLIAEMRMFSPAFLGQDALFLAIMRKNA